MKYFFPLLALVLTAGAAFTSAAAIAQTKTSELEAKAISTPATVSCGVATQSLKVGGTYTVQEGDMLSFIAERTLGHAYRWTELFEINRDRIKDPMALQVGTKLRLPFGCHVSPRVVHKAPKVTPVKDSDKEKPVLNSYRPRVRLANRGLFGDISRLIRGSLCRPLLGSISSGFGARQGRMHEGVDIPRDKGTPIHSVDAGVVVRAEWFFNYGKTIDIEHRPGFVTRYAHCSSMDVHVGQRVQKGQIVGLVGDTGRATCNHLHFEVRLHDRPVNPERFI